MFPLEFLDQDSEASDAGPRQALTLGPSHARQLAQDFLGPAIPPSVIANLRLTRNDLWVQFQRAAQQPDTPVHAAGWRGVVGEVKVIQARPRDKIDRPQDDAAISQPSLDADVVGELGSCFFEQIKGLLGKIVRLFPSPKPVAHVSMFG